MNKKMNNVSSLKHVTKIDEMMDCETINGDMACGSITYNNSIIQAFVWYI